MRTNSHLKRILFLFAFFAAVSINTSVVSLEEYNYGTHTYYCSRPVTVDDHLKNIDEGLRSGIYWLFEYRQDAQIKQEDFRKLSSLDDQYPALKNEIQERYKELKRLSNCRYDEARINIIEYVDPCHMQKDLAWRFGVLLGLYGDFYKEMATCDQETTEKAKVLDFYKASLLFFSYYLNLNDSSPPILQHEDLNAIVSQSEFNSKLDIDFQKAFYFVDETAWIQAIQNLDQQRLEHICELFRSFYHYFLQNSETLPKSYESLAAHLNRIITKLLLQAQKNANYNIDAVNPWMFKLYIDLKKWEMLQKQDEALATPVLHSLLLDVQKQCLRLLPHAFALEAITEENESAICDAVRRRNLFATFQNDLEKGEEIVDEFEFSPVAVRREFIGILNFLNDRARFANGYHVAVKEANESIQKIYNYLSCYAEMSELPITENNALDYLLKIKLFDVVVELWNSHYHVDYEYFGGMHFGFIGFDYFYFPRTTYELRKHILKLCPNLKSYEALTVSINPQKVKDEMDQITPDAWIEESELLRQMCIDDMLERVQHLSNMMNQSILNGIIVGTRGISGAGKSTFLKMNILPLMLPDGKCEAWRIEDLFKGILNPDTFKAALKKLQGDTLNTQVHDEGSNAFKQLLREIADKGSYILDKRQLTPHDIMINLVEPAKNCGNSVWLFDFDISITACISRILARPLHGDDPCPNYESLIEGFRSARRYRAQVAELAIREDTITKYELYATSKQLLIANKISGEPLCIHDPFYFDECLREPTYQEIEEELSQVIDDTFIAEAIAREDISPEQREILEKWRGMTLKGSIQQHVQGGKGTSDESLFEPVVVSPFNGAEWLSDYPQLITYLQSEHSLHTRGVDEAGRGLHWEAEHFESGLNPKYNPNAKAPGFANTGIQMKIGYFIVPMNNLDLYLSENLSPLVARELAVRNENGDLIGLRFFVHPEAYTHFAPLLQAGIPFVPPSKSDFMGSPTGSYNSWLIRRVTSTDRIPFIAKMGTPYGLSDIKHLFTGDDIVKSISLQKYLDKLPDRTDFVLFKETAGLILNYIDNYPAGTVDSGIIICELPEELLKGECRILSLSAVMSCERVRPENSGITSLNANHAELHRLPLIYELMDAAIQKGLVKTPAEFIQIYFIDAYLQAIETIVFTEGYSLAAQGENLYLVINPDNTIKGFAYRDLEGIKWRKNLLESYFWLYRYTNFIKLLNVITQSDSDETPSLLGGPICTGTEKPSPERNLYHYLFTKLENDSDYTSLDELKKLSITPNENLKLLKQLDASYMALYQKYQALRECRISNE